MQFPFYYTFSEFEKNYIKIFKDWLESYPDGTEKDFAYEYKRNIYDRFFNFFGGNAHYEFRIPVKTVDENDNIDDFKLYDWEYVRIVENRLRLFISISEPDRKQKYAKELVSSLKICDDEPYDKNLSFFKDGYILDYETLYIYQHLFSYDFTDYTKKWFLDFDKNALKNFGFSIKRIYKFLEKKINDKTEPVESKISIQTPENDFSDSEPKEKLIILEKLKIIDYIKSIQTKPETISHTAEILSAITGINSTTLYTYLRPMLNANRDDADKNSPYKNNENILNANKTIQKLKIKNTDANN